MTQQYLVGALSLILGELQVVAPNEAAVRDVVRLRQEAECTPPAALGPVVARAVMLIERLWWDALTRGETEAFIREATICAELWEFGVCASLLERADEQGDGALVTSPWVGLRLQPIRGSAALR